MSDPAQPPSDGPAVPDRSTDDSDAGWGDPEDPDDLERLRRERPPHHGD